MFKNFLKVALRSIYRQRAYALINVMGLAIGIACSILITLFVVYESSFDRFHDKADRIVRLFLKGKLAESELSGADTAVPIGPIYKDEIPEVEDFCRVDPWNNTLVRVGDRTFLEDNFYWADSSFFEIFSFPLISGDPATVLTQYGHLGIHRPKVFRGRGPHGTCGQGI